MVPLLPVAIAFVVGILLWDAADGGVLWAGVPLVAAVVALCLKRAYVAILFVTITVGFIVAAAHAPHKIPAGKHVIFPSCVGVVTEHREYEGAQMLIVCVDSCSGHACPHFLVKCLVPSALPEIAETDRIGFTARLRPLESRTDLPDEIDYNAPLNRMGVVAEAVVEPDSISRVIPEPGMLNDIRRMRHDLVRVIANAPLSEGAREFLMATLAGDRSWLSPSTRTLFASTGIAHILALSGLHVGVLTLVLTLLLLPLCGAGLGRYGRMAVIVLALWFFAVLTGLSPSVVRAVVMATLFAICTMLQRVWSPLNALSAAAIVILLFSPSTVYSLGFMLSFVAVLSIIVFADRLNPFDYRRRRLRDMTGYICVTVAAMLGTGMVSAFYFHVFPVGFLVTNIAVTLLLPPLLGGGVVLVALNAIGIRAGWLGDVVDFLYRVIELVAGWVNGLPGAVVSDIWVSGPVLAAYFVVLSLFAVWLYRRRVVWLCAAGIIALFTIVGIYLFPPRFSQSEVFITRSTDETTMLVREGSTLYSLTTARNWRADDVKARDEKRYREYMLRRGIAGITHMADGMCDGSTARRGNVVFTSGRSFIMVSHDSHVAPCGVRPDYAVVCRGFRGDIAEVAYKVRPDTILLSADLNLRRHDRYARELAALGIPYRSLRPAPFHIKADEAKLFDL